MMGYMMGFTMCILEVRGRDREGGFRDWAGKGGVFRCFRPQPGFFFLFGCGCGFLVGAVCVCVCVCVCACVCTYV